MSFRRAKRSEPIARCFNTFETSRLLRCLGMDSGRFARRKDKGAFVFTHTKTQTVHLGTAKTDSPTKWIACVIVSAMDTKCYVCFTRVLSRSSAMFTQPLSHAKTGLFALLQSGRAMRKQCTNTGSQAPVQMPGTILGLNPRCSTPKRRPLASK